MSPTEGPAQQQGLALPVTDPDLEAGLRNRMDEVEKALYGHVQSRFPFVTEAASHLLDAGGKRFRPLLVLLAAEAGAHPNVDDVVTAACVVEITHVGSLYHDDVMDEADLRRGSESANARWDNLVAILTGDFLFAKSSELTALLGADAVRIQAETFTRLVEGQILETVEPGPDEDPLEHYLEVVAGKTGSLIATSARYGARFGGATPEVEQALAAYGEIVGSAFQLSDDIIDVASDSVESGKTPGTDLREGIPTLPVLMAQALCRKSADPADARLLELLAGPLTDDALHAEALALLRAHPAMTQARAYVVDRATEAKTLLGVLPDGPVRAALEAFADVVATRSSLIRPPSASAVRDAITSVDPSGHDVDDAPSVMGTGGTRPCRATPPRPGRGSRPCADSEVVPAGSRRTALCLGDRHRVCQRRAYRPTHHVLHRCGGCRRSPRRVATRANGGPGRRDTIVPRTLASVPTCCIDLDRGLRPGWCLRSRRHRLHLDGRGLSGGRAHVQCNEQGPVAVRAPTAGTYLLAVHTSDSGHPGPIRPQSTSFTRARSPATGPTSVKVVPARPGGGRCLQRPASWSVQLNRPADGGPRVSRHQETTAPS